MGAFEGETLLVLPGLSAATDPKYVGVYGILGESARAAGFERVEFLVWPGQAPRPLDDEITLEGAVACVREAVAKLQREQKRFSFLGRSFGAHVAAYLTAEDEPIAGLDRAILWGPPPLYVCWKWFVRDLAATSAMVRQRDAVITSRFFASLVPFELLLEQTRARTRIAIGMDDPMVPPPFRAHLDWVVARRTNVDLREVPGCVHEVTFDDPPAVRAAYAAALFED